MQDNERTKGLLKLYKNEEIKSMNYVFGKKEDNKYFTKFELELASQINLFNIKVVEMCREIYKNRNNEKKIKGI